MSVIEAPAAMQDEREFAALLDLYRQRRPFRTLEIGVGDGGTLYEWLTYAPSQALVVAVDDRHSNSGRYLDWGNRTTRLVTLLGDSTSDVVRDALMRERPFQWIFIDANHRDAYVRHDFALARKLAARDAVIALHDISETSDPTIEVAPFWRELRESYETIEYVEEGGFGIGVVLLRGETK